MMAKAKIVHRDLPPRMTIRTGQNKRGESWVAYYYEHPRDPVTRKRKLTALGTDLEFINFLLEGIRRQYNQTRSCTTLGRLILLLKPIMPI